MGLSLWHKKHIRPHVLGILLLDSNRPAKGATDLNTLQKGRVERHCSFILTLEAV
jgi:hypothetical protein